MTRLSRFLFLIAFVATLNGPEVLAQATGGMTGVVTDDTGAVVPGVTLEVANQGTGQTRVVVSAADGFYTVPLLAPGQYQVTATLPGFKTAVRDGVIVRVNDTARVDVTMAVGAVEESRDRHR